LERREEVTMRRNVRSAILVLSAMCVFTGPLHAMQGHALVTRVNQYNEKHGVYLIDVATAHWDTLVSYAVSCGTYSGACFSPDGKQIAYFLGSNLKIMDNNGAHSTTVCTGGCWPSWTSTGYIYWSNSTDAIFRVNVTTKHVDTVARLADFTGEKPSSIYSLKMSLDGKRAGCMVEGSSEGSFGFDFPTMTAKSFGSGCQGTVSPNGLLQTRNRGGETVGGKSYNYHQVAYIHQFDTKAIVDTLFAPGATPGCQSACPRFVTHRFSHSSNDHIVFSGEDGLTDGFAYCLSTNEEVDLGNCMPYDIWVGSLPPPPANGPVIALNPTSINLASPDRTTPVVQTVSVTNSGTGTLTAVNVLGAPSWLTVAVSGSGNNQTLANTANPAGLASGAYTATITVTGGGASNSVNYTVTFNVGTTVNAPSALSAAAGAGASVNLSWTDNANNENGFSVERRQGGGAWQRIGGASANASSYTDAGPLAYGTYGYRVRAFAGADSSGWSNVASITVAQTASITITGPDSGAQWLAGSTQHITWTVVGVTQVDLEYSLDDGLTWLLINGTGSVTSSMPVWGNYPFTVPNTCLDNLEVRVKTYGSSWPLDIAGPITVSGCSGARTGRSDSHPTGARLSVAARASGSKTVDFVYDCGGGECPALWVYSTDGACVARVRLSGEPGDHRVSTDIAGRGAGRYIAELRYSAGGRQMRRVVPFIGY
jgi:hypothetical protein